MFPCTGCGVCCRHIGSADELKDYDLGDGTCRHLNLIDNSCKIYDERPDICRVDKMYDIKYYQDFSKKEFYIKNAEACNYLQTLDGIDKSYRLKIEEIECYLG